MTNRTYKIREDIFYDEFGKPHTVYGITLDDALSIPDIFTSRPAAEEFIKLCNRLELSPLHIYEVIDDLL